MNNAFGTRALVLAISLAALAAQCASATVLDVTSNAYYTSNDPLGKYRVGDLYTVTNAAGHVTTFAEFDTAGRPLKIVDPNGLETRLEYWPRGWLKTRKVGSASAGLETTSFDYDSVGQLTKVTLPDGSYVQYTYDPAHRLTDMQDGLGNRIHYTLDGAGNRTGEDAYDSGNVLSRTHSRVIDALNRVQKEIGGTTPATQIVQNGYDGNGNLTSITDPLSRVTTQEFDPLNRLKAVKDPFNGSGAPTSYSYNGQGVLTQVTDPTTLATTYSANGHGEVLTQVSPDTGTTTFTFDAASNVETKLDARGVLATFTNDALNRVTQIAYPDETVTYTWDSCTNGIGRLCSLTDKTGTTSWSYDLWGRVTGKTQVVSGVSQSVGYAYNSAGQLSTVTLPSGRVLTYGYTNNRPSSVSANGTTILDTVLYEPFGPNGGWRWGNSTVSAPNTHTRLFDLDFRPTRITSDLPATGSQPYFDRQVSWDIQSRVQGITDLANGALSGSYGYDALDRLTSATQGASSWGYSYNGIGDRLTSSVGGASTTYSYFTSTHRLQSLSGAQSKSFGFDGAGNTTADGSTTWTYGGNNRPTAAGSVNFSINALGQRVRKVVGSSATRFVFDEAGRLLGEYDDTGAVIQETVWLDDLPVATLRPSGGSFAIYYVHPDHLGTPRLVTRASDNQPVWRWDNTEPFGNSAPDENPSGLGAFAYNLRFPGQYFDVETQKHYNYFRDYDSSIGRYVESDPAGLHGGLNSFAYVSGNPFARTDDLGLYDCTYSIAAHTMDCKPNNPGHPSFSSGDFVSGNNQSPTCPNCQNNPNRTSVSDHGPLPIGDYSVGPQHKGNSRRDLSPQPGTNMGGRFGMQVHGCGNPQTCSDGCIAATTNNVRDRFNLLMGLEEGRNTVRVTP